MNTRLALIGITIVILYGAFLGRHGVLQQTEARYAEVAREMKVSRDFLMPTLNGVPHVQKPPVTYWLAASSMMLFGENEIGARAAPLAAGFGVLLLTAWIGTLWFDRKVGTMALFLLAGSVEFYALSRTLCADMIMTLWSTAAIAAFAYVTARIREPRRMHFLPFFVFMGIAFATKGPMGIVVPVCMAAGWQVYSRRHSAPRLRIPWATGMLITLGLAVGWFVAVAWRYPELWRYFLKYELVDRFFSDVHGRSEPVWYFIPVLLAGWLPWTPLIVPLFRKSDRTSWRGPGGWAVAAWAIAPFLILSLSGSKLATYVLPLLPAIALWFASRLCGETRSRWLTVGVGIQMGYFLLLGSGVAFAILVKGVLPSATAVDSWFLPVWAVAIGLAVGACWKMRKGTSVQRIGLLSVANLLVFASLSSQIMGLAPAMGSGVSLRPLAERIMLEPGWEQAQIVVAGTRGHGIDFYLRRFVDSNQKYADIALPLTPELAARIHPSYQDIRFATNGTPCFVVAKERILRRGLFPPSQWDVLLQQGSFVLLKRRESS